MRKETIGTATLYCGNCLDVFPTLESVNHIITDPPYEVEAHTKQRRVKRMSGLCIEPIPFLPLNENIRNAVSKEIARLSLGWALIFCQVEAVHLMGLPNFPGIGQLWATKAL